MHSPGTSTDSCLFLSRMNHVEMLPCSCAAQPVIKRTDNVMNIDIPYETPARYLSLQFRPSPTGGSVNHGHENRSFEKYLKLITTWKHWSAAFHWRLPPFSDIINRCMSTVTTTSSQPRMEAWSMVGEPGTKGTPLAMLILIRTRPPSAGRTSYQVFLVKHAAVHLAPIARRLC